MAPLSPVHLLREINRGQLTVRDLARRYECPLDRASSHTTVEDQFLVLVNLLRRLEEAALIEPCNPNDPGSSLRVSRQFVQVRDLLGLSLGRLAREQEHEKEIDALKTLHAYVNANLPAGVPFKAELLLSLGELSRCLRSGCYAACVMVCGRILEVTLRLHLLDLGAENPHDLRQLALGGLLTRYAKFSTLPHSHPHLNNVANIIKEVRNPTVHAREGGTPSVDTTLSVLYATKSALEDITKESIAHAMGAISVRGESQELGDTAHLPARDLNLLVNGEGNPSTREQSAPNPASNEDQGTGSRPGADPSAH